MRWSATWARPTAGSSDHQRDAHERRPPGARLPRRRAGAQARIRPLLALLTSSFDKLPRPMQRLPDRRYRPPASSTTTRSCHTLQVTELEPPAQPEAGQQHASLAWAECPRSGSACCLPGTRMARHPPGSRPTGGGRSPELSRECRAGSRYRRDDGGTDPPAGPVPRGCARAASSGDHRAPTAGE